MITVYAAMHVILGFLLAAFLLLLVLPAYRRRIERFATESLKRSLPLTEAEINAGRDSIRAAFAIDVHKLEMKLEDATLAAARQSVEINRRDAKINDLEQAIAAQQMSVEEHENARRVLEQAIMDRLPKVEQRLSEARKLLVQRDREIMLLTDSGAKQALALEEATQINTQQRDELERAKTALETRAARNRETLGDPRFDGEVALRSEIEQLRAKSRDQANLIDRLQKNAAALAVTEVPAAPDLTAELERMKSALAKAEAELLAYRADTGSERAAFDSKIQTLEAEARATASEMLKMKAALKAFADSATDPATGRTSQTLSSKVEISQLQAEVTEHRSTIESLRAEIASSNERLVRQAQHFRDELRRLGGSALGTDGSSRSEAETPRRSLAERIAAPRVPQPAPTEQSIAANDEGLREARTPTGTFLKALKGGGGDTPTAEGDNAEPASSDPAPRRARLLDRIGVVDK